MKLIKIFVLFIIDFMSMVTQYGCAVSVVRAMKSFLESNYIDEIRFEFNLYEM